MAPQSLRPRPAAPVPLPAPAPAVGAGQRYREALAHVATPITITEAMRATIAAAIHRAYDRLHPVGRGTDATATAVPAASDLTRQEFNDFINPETAPNVRQRLFARLLAGAARRGELDGIDPHLLDDDAQLHWLWNETCGWGDVVQQLLDEAAITEVKIIGTTAVGDGARGRVVRPDAFVTTREPLSRAEFLAQSFGVAWNDANPSVTLALPSGMRVHLTRDPRVTPATPGEPGLLLVMRRARRTPWTLADLVQRAMLDTPTAALLALLVHAGGSMLVSGQQGTGKTTLLECLLNTVAADSHVLLIEDNTDEFQLHPDTLVTRLRINDSLAMSAWEERVAVIRENLRMTPDLVVLSEVRGEEASPVLSQAEAGRPTLTTIHADSVPAALARFARLASADRSGNSFARQPELAMQVLARAFHAVVHLGYSRRLGRRYVAAVSLLDGLDAHGQVQLLPLSTAHVTATGITWTTTATLDADGQLIWADGQTATPQALAPRLADLPDLIREGLRLDALARPQPPRATTAEEEVAHALHRARLAMRDGHGAAALDALTVAARSRYDQAVISLIDELLTSDTAVADASAAAIAQAITTIQASLDRWDLAAARTASMAPPTTVGVQRLRESDPGWQAILAEVDRRWRRSEQARQRLAQAHTLRSEGQPDGALQVLREITLAHLPPRLAVTIGELRQTILNAQAQATASSPRIQQAYLRELVQLTDDLEAAREALAALGESGTEADLLGDGAAAQASVQPVIDAAARDQALATSVDDDADDTSEPDPFAVTFAPLPSQPRHSGAAIGAAMAAPPLVPPATTPVANPPAPPTPAAAGRAGDYDWLTVAQQRNAQRPRPTREERRP